MLRVVSNSLCTDGRVFDTDTGEDMTCRLGARTITVTLQAGQPPYLNLEPRVACKVDVAGERRWYANDPRTGDIKELKCLQFADGTRVDFGAGGT